MKFLDNQGNQHSNALFAIASDAIHAVTSRIFGTFGTRYDHNSYDYGDYDFEDDILDLEFEDASHHYDDPVIVNHEAEDIEEDIKADVEADAAEETLAEEVADEEGSEPIIEVPDTATEQIEGHDGIEMPPPEEVSTHSPAEELSEAQSDDTRIEYVPPVIFIPTNQDNVQNCESVKSSVQRISGIENEARQIIEGNNQ